MDRNIGHILDAQDELNLTKNTIVISFSDNGGLESDTRQSPQRKGKGQLHKESIRKPLIIRLPGIIKEETLSHETVSSYDFLPTFCNLLGVCHPANLDGISLLPLLTNGIPLPDRSLYWHYPHYHLNPGMEPGEVTRDGKWKEIEWYGKKGVKSVFEQYNLEKDISESSKVTIGFRAVTITLSTKLQQYREKVFATLQSFLTGGLFAQYVIWDGIRALDFLMTRDEVAPKRIGMTGRSGRRFQSLNLPAFDDRICATAPENQGTNNTRIMPKHVPRDGEYNPLRMLAEKIEQTDFTIARSEKSALNVATANDKFNTEGTDETFEEVSRIHKTYGKETDFKMIKDIALHILTPKNNEVIYAFFQKYLKNSGSPEEEIVERFSGNELKVTKPGQMVTSLNSQTVFSVNSRKAQQFAEKLNTSWKRGTLKPTEIIESANKKCGYKEPNLMDNPVMTVSVKGDGYTIGKYFIEGEGKYPIPDLLMVLKKRNNKIIIYNDSSGKENGADKGGSMEWFVNSGFAVFAQDLVGTGEEGTGDLNEKKDLTHAVKEGLGYSIGYPGEFFRHSVLRVRTSEVVKLASAPKKKDVEKVYAIASGRLSPVLLHHCASTNAIDKIALLEPYSSYLSAATTKYHNPSYLESFVPRALQSHDLPYLADSLVPRRVVIQNAKNGDSKEVDADALHKVNTVASELYSDKKKVGNLIIGEGDNDESVINPLFNN